MAPFRTILRLVLLTLVVVACSPAASKGTMPPPNGRGGLDQAALPDFVVVGDRDGKIAGYVSKQVFLDPGSGESWPVYSDDLRTVVGHMVPDKGFVPSGVDPDSVPAQIASMAPASAVPPSDLQVLYVRNNALSQVYVAVLGTDSYLASGGFWGSGYIGAGCYAMPEGSRLVMLDRSPIAGGALVSAVISVRGTEAKPPARWMDVSKDLQPLQGEGQPSWWRGDPLSC